MNRLKNKPPHLSVKLFAILIFGFLGCSSSKKPWEVTHPATGSIEYKGKPIEAAELTLFPLDQSIPESVRPKGRSTADGKFELGTYSQSDGAPAGKYKITVVRNQIAVSKDTIVTKPNDLPGKYSNLSSTDLVVEIVAGKNELPAILLR